MGGAVLFVSTALAGYPSRGNGISDLADILPAKSEAELLDSIAWFKRSAGGELIILTLPSWKDLKTSDVTWESFNTNLFNRWGVGSRFRNDGVLFVTAIKERKLRIELGLGFKRCYDATMKQILERSVVPLFKETRYGAGMALGAKKIIQSLPKKCPAEAKPVVSKPVAQPNYSPTYSAPRVNVPVEPFSPWLPIGGGLTIAALAVGASRLNRRKKCSQCRTELERLNEQADDEYLTAGQQLEEQLRSVNYDVWRCPKCNNHELIRRNQFFSSFDICPSCSQKTLLGVQNPLVPPSEFSEGLARLDRSCRHCQHHDSQNIVLPRLQSRRVDNNDDDGYSFRRVNSSRDTFQSNNASSSNNASNDNSSGGGRSGGGGASADF